MLNNTNLGQIIFTGVTVNDLLSLIEQLLDAKIGILPKNENIQSGYLSRKEAAKLLKVSLPCLASYTKEGWLKAYRIGKRVLYKESEIREALERVASFKHKKGGGSTYGY